MSKKPDNSDKNAVTQACPDCGSIDLIQDNQRGELICTNCGAVVEDM
ncbi:MAG: TFIIB-type zinc ribbon-containing protein, partial [Candidatus Kariarchaeum pelagius]